jgi:DNA repair protein RAD50
LSIQADQTEAERLDAQLKDVRVQANSLTKENEEASRRARLQLEGAEKEMATVVRLQEEVDEIDRVIASLEEKRESIAHMHDSLSAAEAEERRLEEELDRKRRHLAERDEVLAGLKRMKVLLEKNVQLKKKLAEIEQLELDLGFAAEVEDFTGEIERLRQRVQTSRDIRARAEGEFNQVIEQIRTVDGKLNSATYRDIDSRVSKAWIAHETTATAVRDLQRYHGALDRALMKYHQHKMQEINAAIANLWQAVYKGNDIDCIAIRSDVEAEGEGTGKRSYNYRVVMLNNEVELEMRGRCSAGQKVLASIIIRLALAESFCHNCGILALDEPTTNLDRHNIEGLAEALCKLIEARRHSNNFQLIIITHDDEFVKSLSKLQVCDSSFRVYKDSHGYSRIKRELIYDLQ